jgi:hypothetical protein
MTIKIEVTNQDKPLTESDVNRIRRVANVFRQNRDTVDIKWNNAERDSEPVDQRYIREIVTNY